MMNWFQRSGYITFDFIRKTSLQLQILLINAIGLLNLVGNNFNWGWLKGDLQLKKIWELPVLESDSSDVKDINWIKTVLSQIVVARFVINSVSFVAHVANIYTILTRDRQNLLIFWMVLSFVKDILLEVIVVIITLILWHNGSITTSLLIEFIVKKAIRLAVSIWKWCITLKWYMQLRKVAKIREFFESIARRSNMSVIDTVRRIGHSLDDASLNIAIVRRGKYMSLLNLDELSEEFSNRMKFNRMCFDLRTSKSLTTLITSESYDTNDTNDYDSIANELSVAEKSMKMLNITAEDIMDARARIQERSYWDERNATTKMSNPVEEVMTCFSLEKDEKEIEDIFRDRQIAVGNKEGSEADNKEENVDVTENVAVEKENTTRYSPMEGEKEANNSETVSRNGKKEIFIEKREEAVNLLSLKNGNITPDDFYTTSEEEKEGAQKVTKIVQCSLSGLERNINACPSLVKDTEVKLRSAPVSCEYKRIGKYDQRRHRYRVETKPASVAINANTKEHSGSSKMLLLTCHCASSLNIHTQKNKENSRSTNAKDKNLNRDIDGKRSKYFISNVAQEDKSNGHRSALKYLERYLKKRVQTCQECSKKQPVAWNSKSLAQTARPSGYEKRFVAPNKLSACQTNLISVQTDTSNESEDSLNKQCRLKCVQQTRYIQSSDLHLVNDLESFRKKNYMKFKKREMMKARTLEAFDLILLEDEKRIKARNRYNLPPSRKLSAEEREAIELRALKAYNEQTLLEDKKELEAKKKCDSSLRKTKIPKTESKTYNNVALFENREETETITENDLSTNRKRSIEKLKALAAYSKFTSSDYNLIADRKHDSSKNAVSLIYEEDVEVPRKTLNHLEADNVPDRSSEADMSHLLKTRDNANSDLNEHNARHMRVSFNLREITRNIEWTCQPGGITLINKNLQGDLSEKGRSRENQQRDIIDNNTANILHNAFFFKPEIIMRIFRRAQTRLEESLSNFWSWRRRDFNVEFVCRVNNEINIQDRDSLLNFDFEWIMGGRNNLSHSLLLNTNRNRVAEEENSHDLCIIFIGQEEFLDESETAIVEDSAELQRNVRLSIDNVQATNILMFDANPRQIDSATTDSLSVQFVISVLRNFSIETLEEDIRDTSIEQLEESGNISDVAMINDFPSHIFNTNDMSNDGGNNIYDKTLFSQSGYCSDMINDENKQILYLSNNCSDNVNVSSVKSLEHDNCYDSQDESYLSAIDINFEDKISENNLSVINIDNDVASRSLNFVNNNDNDDNQFGMLNNKTEENTSNAIFENSTKIFSSKTLFTKSYNCQTPILKSAGKEFQKFADEPSTSENKRKRSISNLGIKSGDTILQSQNVETLRLTATTRNSIRSEDKGRNIYGKTNVFSTDQFPGMYSSDESEFNFLYEKIDDRSEPTLHEGSLMEEFSNDIIPLRASSDTSAHNSPHSFDNAN